jgi:alpha-amylase
MPATRPRHGTEVCRSWGRAWGRAITTVALAALAGLCAGLPARNAAAQPALLPDIRPVPARPRYLQLPPHWQRGAFIEIFVRAYADSDGDGIGDLKGLTSRLDYLKDLGIRGIWLMPVTTSADHDHGYATTDFRGIEPAYGTLADLDELLRQARRRGIGVIMDYVINHSSAEHPWFVQARAQPTSPWRDWYVFSDTAPPGWEIWGKYPWYHTTAQPWTFRGEVKDLPLAPPEARDFYFGTFGPHMPDFNLRHPRVWAYHEDSLRFWLNRGLAGYRLDAVPHMVENSARDWNDQPESRRLAKRLQDLVTAYPQRMVVCEATAQPQAWGDPAVCGGAFAFGLVHHYVGAAMGQAESVQQLARYWHTALPTMATFVSNHDIFAGQRLWDQVRGDERRYKLAAAGYLLQPGTPYLYYGEEVGQAGVTGLPGDQPLRAPMSWAPDTDNAGFTRGTPFRPVAPNVATHNARMQQRDPGSILAFYKAMLALRNGRPSIARGRYAHGFADGLVLGYQRVLGRERTLVLINYGEAEATPRVAQLPAGASLRQLHPQPAGAKPSSMPRRVGSDGVLATALPPQSVTVLALDMSKRR